MLIRFFSSLFTVCLLSMMISCKDSGTVNSVKEKEVDGQNDNNKFEDPLVVPTPEGYYEPKGLKKMNLLDMYKLGTTGQLKKDFPLKDEQGNDFSWAAMDNSNNQLFMQIYTDESGKPVEGVVYKITDEIKTMIMKVRIVSTPTPQVKYEEVK